MHQHEGLPGGDRQGQESGTGQVVQLGCVREVKLGRRSARTAEVALRFGLPRFGTHVTIVEPTMLALEPGKIVALVGPSGSGKSSLLTEVERAWPGSCVVNRVTFPAEAAIVDRVAPSAPLGEALALFSACALGEPRLWLRRFAELSDGEKFRVRLARALGLHSRSHRPAPLLCDEFCSVLHRRAAKAIAFNLQKLVRRRNLSLVVAMSNEDVLDDLQPDVVVRLQGRGRCRLEQCTVRPRRRLTLLRDLRIERATKREYDAFAAMHYRTGDELGFVDKVFVLREQSTGEALGIVVYAYSPLELSLRNQATGGKFVRNARRLNRSMRILRRLVIHPDVRGGGLGYYLVRRTLARVGTEYVECLAAMGEVNPVFEKAGMRRIGCCGIPNNCRKALEALRRLDVDPHSRDFTLQVCRRRRVRAIVAGVVFDWYGATTGGGEARVSRQRPEVLAQTFRGLVGTQPVYYLWRRQRVA